MLSGTMAWAMRSLRGSRLSNRTNRGLSKSPEECYPRDVNLHRTVFFLLLVFLIPTSAFATAPGRAAFERGRAALDAGDTAAARSAFEEAATQSRGWLLPRMELAELAVQRRERLEEERGALRDAAGPETDVPRVHRLLAQLSELLGDDAAAAASYGEAIARMPYEIDLRQRRAAVYFRLRLHAEAALDWDRCVRARPDEPHLRAQLADALEQIGRCDEAREQLRAMIRLEPAREAPVRRLARFLERRGENREAAAEHAKADRLRAAPQRENRNLRPLLPSKY